jgi:hypothetical protein
VCPEALGDQPTAVDLGGLIGLRGHPWILRPGHCARRNRMFT